MGGAIVGGFDLTGGGELIVLRGGLTCIGECGYAYDFFGVVDGEGVSTGGFFGGGDSN